jgi:tricorn protease
MADSSGGYYSYPALHGEALAFVCENEAWVVALSGGVPRRLTAAAGAVSHLRFSPDGAQLAFSVAESGYEEVRQRAARKTRRLAAPARKRPRTCAACTCLR